MSRPKAQFNTSEGDFTVELYLDTMPITCSNFIDLVNIGFYNGLHFHRVIDNFMLQFGCPYSSNPKNPNNGTGGPKDGSSFTTSTGQKIVRKNGGNIPDELTQKYSNEPGTLSMANTGEPNSGGSQFFINTVHNDFLDWWRSDLSESQHPVFGKVVSGMSVVNKIGKMRCDANDAPIKPVKVISIKMV